MEFKERYYLVGVLVFSIALAIGISIGFYIYDESDLNGDINQDFSEQSMKSSLFIPGVNNRGDGIAAILETNIRDGSGLVLVNINNLDAGSSTQQSARIAAKAAKNYLGIEEDEIDVIYNIKTDSPAIDGPSAGAAMAVSLISLFENKTLNDKVSITGFVDEDQTIGPASGIEEKAKALNSEGIETLLVSEQVTLPRNFIRKESCTPSNEREYCEVNYSPEGELEISGLEIIAVKNLEETMKYFYK